MFKLKYIGHYAEEEGPKPVTQLKKKKTGKNQLRPIKVIGGQSKEGNIDKEVFLSVSSFLLNFPLNNLDSPLVQELVSLVSLVPFLIPFRQSQRTRALNDPYFLATCFSKASHETTASPGEVNVCK